MHGPLERRRFHLPALGRPPDVFAAIAPSPPRAPVRRRTQALPDAASRGREDPLVKFEVQMRAVNRSRRSTAARSKGKDWTKGCTLYPSSKDAPGRDFVHPGTHQLSRRCPALIVKFFKEHARKP